MMNNVNNKNKICQIKSVHTHTQTHTHTQVMLDLLKNHEKKPREAKLGNGTFFFSICTVAF